MARLLSYLSLQYLSLSLTAQDNIGYIQTVLFTFDRVTQRFTENKKAKLMKGNFFLISFVIYFMYTILFFYFIFSIFHFIFI